LIRTTRSRKRSRLGAERGQGCSIVHEPIGRHRATHHDLCTDAAKDVNGQIFHAEKSHYHTYHYGEVARSLYKYENNGEFTVDELIKLIPASLMAGIPNVAPVEEPREMGS
jgi:hypothetical protein